MINSHSKKNANTDLKPCDIVLPVYNGLTYLVECVNSIRKFTDENQYTLYIIDDCSDSFTQNYLKTAKDKYPNIHYHRNRMNMGFVKSCNTGIKLGSAPYIILINSDVIVTPAWLSHLLECAQSDRRIATVNPFTNSASNIDIPMSPGANFFGMNYLLSRSSLCEYPDVVTGVGFCILLKRTILEQVGLFDEIYGKGYCEESDLCMRLTTKGYRTVIADNTYVFHKGKTSFKDRGERYKKNRKIFDKRWQKEYEKQFHDFLKNNPLKNARNIFGPTQKWNPEPSMRQTYRLMRDRFQHEDYSGVLKEALKGIRQLPASKRDIVTSESVRKVTIPDKLRVTYVLHNLTVAGGVLSVVQLVNELILLGVEARIVALREYPEIYNWKFFSRPIVFKNVSELMKNFPESDIAVATHWTTADWVKHVIEAGHSNVGAYFIQDYESWFFPESDKISREKVKKTYEYLKHKIVKSDWLQNLLAKDGFLSEKIPLGMDLNLFYPRDVEKASHPVLLAMARPRTPRRGFPHVIEALNLVKNRIPDVEIILFGDDLSNEVIPFEYRDEGIITDQDKLAELYSYADVFIDGSDFQGFGRTALEAMACGTACVLTNVGGVSEYARHEKNCLLVEPKKSDDFAIATIRLFEDSIFRNRIVREGLETVKTYCHKREAKETLEFFHKISLSKIP